jgi:hypothetical protein
LLKPIFVVQTKTNYWRINSDPEGIYISSTKGFAGDKHCKKMGKRNIKALLTRNAQNMKCAKNPFEQKTFDCQKSQ